MKKKNHRLRVCPNHVTTFSLEDMPCNNVGVIIMKGRYSFFMIFYLYIFVSLIVCMVDYVYRHNVSGTVTDSHGNPIPAVLVSRSLEGAGTSDYGEKQQTTHNQGMFEFLHEQVSGKPNDKITWILTFEHSEYQTKQVKIDLFWTEKKDDALDYGYVKKDILVQLNQ